MPGDKNSVFFRGYFDHHSSVHMSARQKEALVAACGGIDGGHGNKTEYRLHWRKDTTRTDCRAKLLVLALRKTGKKKMAQRSPCNIRQKTYPRLAIKQPFSLRPLHALSLGDVAQAMWGKMVLLGANNIWDPGVKTPRFQYASWVLTLVSRLVHALCTTLLHCYEYYCSVCCLLLYYYCCILHLYSTAFSCTAFA